MDISRRELLRVTALGAAGTAGCTSGGDRSRWRTLTTPTGYRTADSTAPPNGGQTTEPAGTPTDGSTATPESTPTEQPIPAPKDYCQSSAPVDSDDSLKVSFDASEWCKCKGAPLDNFEDLDRWAAYEGSLSANTTNAYSGSQSALVEAAPSEKRAWIYREFDRPVDLSGHDLSLALKLDVPDTEGVVVRLNAPDYRNAMFLGRSVWGSGWTRVDLGPRRSRGSPDLTQVTEISVQVYTGGGTRTRFSIDSVRMRPRSGSGKVVLTFGDNFVSQYEEAFPRMERFGFPGVVGVVPDTATWDQKISLAGMREMQDAGWDMVSHPQQRGSLRELSRADQERAIRESKQWLHDRGFERGADFVLWPFGHYDRTALEVARRYHYLGFDGSGPPVGMISAPLIMGRVAGADVERTKRAIDFAAEYGLVLVLAYQAIANSTTGLAGETFEETLQHIQRTDLDVVSASELWESLRARRGTPSSPSG